MADIALNFLPIEQQVFTICVYRKPYEPGSLPSPGVSRRRLPLQEGGTGDFLVTHHAAPGFTESVCSTTANRELTKDALFSALLERCTSSLSEQEYRRHPDDLRRRVFFLLQQHEEGRQEVWLEPYYLAARDTFGFLADFSFFPKPEHRGSRRSQQLALSLDHRFLANTNFYADRFAALEDFGRRFHGRLFPLFINQVPLHVAKQLGRLPALSLQSKQYVFRDGRTSLSQFLGVKEYGPLHPPPPDAQLCFLYRPEDRALSQDLYRALHGDSFKTFPGFAEMFQFSINKNNVTGITLRSFEANDIVAAAGKVLSDAAGRPTVAVVITPFDAWDDEEIKAPYWLLKHAFLSRRIPTQVVSIGTLATTNTLKWAASNIGLGILAKMGAAPWKVTPRTERCLIVGIGKAHRWTGSLIEKYFAYSVLTDSSGVYEEMRVLGEAMEEQDYLEQLHTTLVSIVREYSSRFSVFVIHVPFAIRRTELDTIHNALKASVAGVDESRLVTMRFDDDSKFFGYAPANNSLVPHESSFVRLGDDEFLVWFEGLQYHNPNVRKRFGRPVHVRFDYPRSGLSEERKRDYLQDALNLSGANWRGFNAKSLPVSVYYAKLIARHISHFQALGLSDVDFTGLPPWFL